MDILYRSFLPEIWLRVMNHITNMEDVCRLAMVNKRFYRLNNMDFRSLCYKNVVYRLNGETWAKAFLCTNQRTLAMADWRSEEKFSRFITCCPYTGTLAMVLKYNKLLITKLDFGQKIFKCVNSFHERIHGDLHKVQLINKATQMIVQTNTSFIVYDLMDDRIAKVYERINLHSYNANTLCYNDGTLVDLCNQKEYKVQLSFPVTFILNIDLYGYIKYIGYWNDQKEFVLIENATGQHYVLFSSNSLYETSSIRVFSCLNQVMMQGDNTRIYKIKTGDCVFKNFPYRAGIDYKMQGMDGMHLLHNNKLIGYCKRKKEWREMGTCHYRASSFTQRYYTNNGLLSPSTINRACRSDVVTFTHLDWSSGRLILKSFPSIPIEKVGFDYLKIANLKRKRAKQNNKLQEKFESTIQQLTRMAYSNQNTA